MNADSVSAPCRRRELGALSPEGSWSTEFCLDTFSTQHNTRQKAAGRLQKSLGFLSDLEGFLRTPESNLGVVLSSLVEKFYPSPNIRKHLKSIWKQSSSSFSLGDLTGMKSESGEIQEALVMRGCSPERFAVQLLRLRSDVGVEVKEKALARICRDQASLRRSAVAVVAAAESRALGTAVRSHDYQDNAERHCVPARSSDMTVVNDRKRAADREERGEHKFSSLGELLGPKQAADEESGSQGGVQAQKGFRMRNEGQRCGGNAGQGEAATEVRECAPTGEAAAQPGGSKLYREDRLRHRDTVVGYSPCCSPASIKKKSSQDSSTRHDREYRSGSDCQDQRRLQKEGSLETAHQVVETSTTDAHMKPLPSLSESCSPVSAFLPSTSTTAVGASSPSDSAGASLSVRLPSSASCAIDPDRGAAGVATTECFGEIEQRTASQVSGVPYRHCSPSPVNVKLDCRTNLTLSSGRTSSECPSPCESSCASSSSHRSVSLCEETVGSRGCGCPASKQAQPRLAEVLQAAHREQESNEAPREGTEARLEGQAGVAVSSPPSARDFPEKGGCSLWQKKERTVEREQDAATEVITGGMREAEVKEFRRGLRNRTQTRREKTRRSAGAGGGGEGEVETKPDTLGVVSACHHPRHEKSVKCGGAVLSAVSHSDQGNSCEDGGPCPEDRALSMVSAPSAATPARVEGVVQELVRGRRREQERLLPKQEQWRRRSKAERGGRGRRGDDESAEGLSAEVLSRGRRHFLTESNLGEGPNPTAAGDVSPRGERRVRLTTKRRGIVLDSWTHKSRGEVTVLGGSSCISRRRRDQSRFACPGERQGMKGNRSKQVPSFASLRGYVWHVCPRSLPAGASFNIADILALNDTYHGGRESPSTPTRSSSFSSECFVPVGVDVEGDQREGQEADSHSGSEDPWNSEKWHAGVLGKQSYRDTLLARKWWRLDGTLLRVFDSRAELLPELVIDMRDVCRVDDDDSDEEDLCSTGASKEQDEMQEEMSAGPEVRRISEGQRDHTRDGNDDNDAREAKPRLHGDQLTRPEGCMESHERRARSQPKVCPLRRFQDSFRAGNKDVTVGSESAGIGDDVFSRTETVFVPGGKNGCQSRDEGDEEEDGETLWQALGYAWIDGAADRFGATARWKLTLTFSDCVRSPLQVVCSSRPSQRMWTEGLRSASSIKTGHQAACALAASLRAARLLSKSVRTSNSEDAKKTQRLSLCGPSRVGMSDSVSSPYGSLLYTEHPHLFQSGTTVYFPSRLSDSLVSCCDALSPRVGSHLSRLRRSWPGSVLHVSRVCDTPEGTTKPSSLTTETGSRQATAAALEAFNEALGISQIEGNIVL